MQKQLTGSSAKTSSAGRAKKDQQRSKRDKKQDTQWFFRLLCWLADEGKSGQVTNLDRGSFGGQVIGVKDSVHAERSGAQFSIRSEFIGDVVISIHPRGIAVYDLSYTRNRSGRRFPCDSEQRQTQGHQYEQNTD